MTQSVSNINRLSLEIQGLADTDIEAISSATAEIYRDKKFLGSVYCAFNKDKKLINVELGEHGNVSGIYQAIVILTFKNGEQLPPAAPFQFTVSNPWQGLKK